MAEKWVALKFGGTSVATAEGWSVILGACRQVEAEGGRALVVCSAVSGVSDHLEQLIELARAGGDVEPDIERLRARHVELARDLGLELPSSVDKCLAVLRECLEGVRLLREASPRTQARALAQGELMSTSLGYRWLQNQGLDAAWTDARDLLCSESDPSERPEATYLSARVDPTARKGLLPKLPKNGTLVTQGFIASNSDGETVLLGRGGSDTSAAYLAATVGAERVEIWTDVPGLFTAHPQKVPAARHLTRLSYDEAAAMASLGARVIHPRCVGAAARSGVPILVRSTYHPEAEGTVISGRGPEHGVRAVTARKNLVLLRMSRPSQWQPVGFVADVSQCFKTHQFSIDLMSTSPSTLTVTVDPASAPQTDLDGLVADLREHCEVTVEQPVASVSLVGTGVREQLARVGRAIHGLDGLGSHMVTQGAADHHLTFVVNQSGADALVEELHGSLFGLPSHAGVSSNTWHDLQTAADPGSEAST